MAFGNSLFQGIGGAVGDLFAGQAAAARGRIKGQGDFVEADNYDLAAQLARQNEEFTRQSTAVKDVMTERQIYRTIGAQTAGIAGSGFQQSGTALDLMRSSATEGALSRALVQQQGLITEAGYQEQAKSYDAMAGYARWAGQQEIEQGDKAESNSWITAGIKGAGAIASLFI